MSKSVYSIVLDDDVINFIDLMAVKQNTSRSNLINRILAQHISLPTTETMLSDIYNSMNETFKNHSSLALQLLGNSSIINMRSALQYKYNPSVKYTVEIFDNNKYLGQLKISMRSQNQTLINILDNFFCLWTKLEMSFTGLKDIDVTFDTGKYQRYLRYYDCDNYSDCGNDIALYIDLLDKCMKEYFSCYTISPAIANKNVQQLYIDNISNDIAKL